MRMTIREWGRVIGHALAGLLVVGIATAPDGEVIAAMFCVVFLVYEVTQSIYLRFTDKGHVDTLGFLVGLGIGGTALWILSLLDII